MIAQRILAPTLSRPTARPHLRISSKAWLSGAHLAAFNAAGTNAHRLFTSPDGWVERFGEDVLISYKSDAAREELRSGLAAWCNDNKYPPQRVFGKFLPRQNAERISPVLLDGDATLPLTTVVEENSMRFGLDFGAGYSAGLFIDQRANRALVHREEPKRLLNTFAYTCSFSVTAALVGAETVSVDLSKKSLDRGRENFALNGLDDSKHRFFADDVLDVLPRLARKNEKFDIIILDPPTFSRGNKGRRFQVEQDLEALLLAAFELTAPCARILVSTNCTRLNRRALESIARFALKATRRAAEFHAEPPLPDIPPDAAAQTLWLGMKS
ncbi:SAM-dependent methyltransferase-like protein [Chthoniobacter flavus Ellin428]|uniref:SAM-dependent methyltransferase-like protein n=1 Tax=Chthoniobacter flavus Ellin428 TaxID=497964 RepID=B4CUH2_9BACT|nr:SAM-dependent methyltransferase-like protein [Chthoniobacter flavus Ellin428]TCO94762.1 23S rRNA (cytosine1962-C5)-methyltransferase [Chthoniobacter flavus]